MSARMSRVEYADYLADYWIYRILDIDSPIVDEVLRAIAKEVTMEDNNDDYITLLPTVNSGRALVVIMTYDKPGDTWRQRKCSDALALRAAQALAESWSAATKLEVR